MEEYLSVLSACPLFFQISTDSIFPALHCLGAVETRISRDMALFHEGDPATFMGIVLSGAIQIIRTDPSGNRVVILSAPPGAVLGDAYLCAGLEQVPASAIAVQDSTVLLLNGRKLLTACEKNCPIHQQILKNMMRSVAQKNLALNRKIYIMSRRTTREKLVAFLTEQADQHRSAEFRIPYDRQALSDYLGVERSAMSAEIGKLKRDGCIDCKGSWFRLKGPQFHIPG